jgi:purine-nucleoside phosphorylase
MKRRDPGASAAWIKRLSSLRPELAVIGGTGFAEMFSEVVAEAQVPYNRIPGFPRAQVPGHSGELILGRLAGEPILVLAGRSHYYEGRSMSEVVFAVRVLAAFGVRSVLLTNAAGGINQRFRPGDFMVLEDHINLMGVNPLVGYTPNGLPAFVDLSRVYDPALIRLLRRAARSSKLRLWSGVYIGVSGPSYETPAEIRAFAKLGADAVGMSTVPEAIAARQCGLKVAGLSCITNMASGIRSGPISHREVLETTRMVRKAARKLLFQFARLYGRYSQDSN